MSLFVLTVEKLFGLTVEAEHKFHPTRKWRIDFAVDPQGAKIAIEVEGGVWINGRHNRSAGFLKDMKKYNALTAAGWRLIRVTPGKLHSMETYSLIKEMIDADKTRKQNTPV